MHVSEDVCREKREEAEAEMSKKNKNPTQRMWGKTKTLAEVGCLNISLSRSNYVFTRMS